jgi:DNA repair protein RecO (recombination protein O)
LPYLQEASIIHPYDRIRTSIRRTTYASCWCELVYLWMEEGQEHPEVFQLLEQLLDQLNSETLWDDILHIAFQIRFMAVNGFRPGLEQCSECALPIDRAPGTGVTFHVKKGGILCQRCGPGGPGYLSLSKGTVKRLSWILNRPLTHLERLRFSPQSIDEALHLLDAFVPYHLGKETKSAKMLQQLRGS